MEGSQKLLPNTDFLPHNQENNQETEAVPRNTNNPVNGNPDKKKRKRTMYTSAQLKKLEDSFEKENYPDINEREELAKKLNILESNVQIWFQNRRARKKKNGNQKSNFDNDSIFYSSCPLQNHPEQENNENQMSLSTFLQIVGTQAPPSAPEEPLAHTGPSYNYVSFIQQKGYSSFPQISPIAPRPMELQAPKQPLAYTGPSYNYVSSIQQAPYSSYHQMPPIAPAPSLVPEYGCVSIASSYEIQVPVPYQRSQSGMCSQTTDENGKKSSLPCAISSALKVIV